MRGADKIQVNTIHNVYRTRVHDEFIDFYRVEKKKRRPERGEYIIIMRKSPSERNPVYIL